MNTLERLNKIAEKGRQIVEKENEEKRVRQAFIDTTIGKIKSLAPRINALIKIYSALIKNKVECEQFVAEGYYHKIGFHTNKEDGTIKIGIKGGGWDGDDFAVDSLGNIVVCPDLDSTNKDSYGRTTFDDYCSKSERFIGSFDEFEKKVYEYVDNL